MSKLLIGDKGYLNGNMWTDAANKISSTGENWNREYKHV